MELRLGKVERGVLEHRVLRHMPLAARPGLDGASLELSGEVVVAHNPAVGVPLECLGFFAFHYAACNVAVKFARPELAVCGIYMPPSSTADDLEAVAREFGREARAYGVRVVAGHTGVYEGLTLPLVSVTVMGRRVRRPEVPEPGDHVLIVGEVGAEAVWLASLASGREAPLSWRELTCLPAALRLSEVRGVKLMHDVSEGGLLGALLEVVSEVGLGAELTSARVPLCDGVEGLGVDPLIAPSYGAMVVVASEEGLNGVEGALESLGVRYSVVGRLTAEKGLRVDGRLVEGVERTKLDELYGRLTSADPVLASVECALRELERIPGAEALIPQVGMNLVYAKEGAASLDDVAGLSGRVVMSMGRPKVCGRVMYGGSRYLASLLLEVMKIDPSRRACVNIKASEEVLRAVEALGLSLRTVPPIKAEGLCPIAIAIRGDGVAYDAYYHPGAHGVEPSLVIVGGSPRELVRVLAEVARLVARGH
ncbi:MAG: hypothetical protein DRJ56_00760 [Thermoprotei archaeon]|nr:MAG: hypothetical protein DRJ56_00760 [Thermoprotei archaeon]